MYLHFGMHAMLRRDYTLVLMQCWTVTAPGLLLQRGPGGHPQRLGEYHQRLSWHPSAHPSAPQLPAWQCHLHASVPVMP